MSEWKLQEKILSPYKRLTTKNHPDRNKLMIGSWTTPEFDALQNHNWVWTMKADGTNIRVNWDGIRVSFGGRTEKMVMPGPLGEALEKMFPEEIMESVFGPSKFTLFGEGIGPGIQKGGGLYCSSPTFVMFDAYAYHGDAGVFLRPDDMRQLASSLGIDAIPYYGTFTPLEAIARVNESKEWGNFGMFPNVKIHEGLVGKPVGDLRDRAGARIQMKVKTCEEYTTERNSD